MRPSDPNFDRGLAFGWLSAAITLIVMIWLLLFAGDLLGAETSQAHSFLRTVVNRSFVTLVFLALPLVTVLSVFIGLIFSLPMSFLLHPSRRAVFVVTYFVFANVFVITLCSALLLSLNADPALNAGLTMAGLRFSGGLQWLFRFTPALHVTWLLSVVTGLCVGIVAFEWLSFRQNTRRQAARAS